MVSSSNESYDRGIILGNAAAPGTSTNTSKFQTVQREDGKLVDFVIFPPGDPEDPRNWPLWRKWSIIIALLPIDLSGSFAASGFSPASMEFSKDMHVSTEVATLGLSMYVLGLAFGPMALAPLSEVGSVHNILELAEERTNAISPTIQYFGRSPVYIIFYGIFLLFLVGTALVENLGGFLVLRILSGLFVGVTTACLPEANFGGTIADLFEPHDTGIAMSCFLWAATVGSPLGYFLFSFVAQTKGWRVVFWALLGICGGFWLIMAATLKETRHSVLLIRRAEQERKRTGNESIEVPDNMKQRGSNELFRIALSRPFRFLATEAIIQFGAIYNGYLYGLSFLFNSAFSLVFGPEGHGFDGVGVGLSFLGICVGITLGPFTNLWQEAYYQRWLKNHRGKGAPEARIQLGKIAAVVFPISLFWFSWTSYKSIHWIVPIIASGFWGWSFYTLILMTYTYTEDSYKVYSASALAALGLIRNIAGAGFPLFAEQLFQNEGNEWAGSILAFLALVMIPIPFIWSRYGKALRMKSPWAKQHMDDLTPDEVGDDVEEHYH
ncbi:MAG: hypothetical protein M1827_006028 [Pycnora praestabilis]|nr:MAG: hypothetical protein M1827_006028 [Pycnora praestabilis]